MTVGRRTRRALWALSLAVVFAGACAQTQTQPVISEYQPQVGQDGKDVIWVPTSQALVEEMLNLAKATPDDYLIDLGSGDGRTVIAAARRGIRAHGIEYNPDLVELSKRNAAKAGVSDRTTFVQADLFESDLSKATVITMFLLPDINLRLRPKLLDLKPGTRVVSNSFTMGDWKEDDMARVKDACASYCAAYLWIVPAKVQGTWRLDDGELTLTQNYQMISGSLVRDGKAVTLANGKLKGDRIIFNAAGSLYHGTVTGNTMAGTISSGGTWKATRAGS